MLSWSERVKKAIENIEKEDYSKMDRLQKYFALKKLLNTLGASVQGWKQWVDSETLERYNDKQLTEICRAIGNFVTQFLQYDYEVTKPVEEEAKKPTQKNKNKTAKYIR